VRRLALLALAIAVMLAVAAVASAGPKDPQVHKRAADVRIAKTLIMNHSDLPAGFADKGPQKSSGPTPDIPCTQPNLHALTVTADVSSHDFVRSRKASYAEVSSEASFFLQPAQAKRAVDAVTTTRFGNCVKTAVVKSVNKTANGKFKIVSSHLTPISENVGELHAKFWDMFLTFKANGLLFRDELVLAFLRHGRVVSNLMLNSLNGLTEEEAKNISERLTVRLVKLPKSVAG
jgi:hypothetical protein